MKGTNTRVWSDRCTPPVTHMYSMYLHVQHLPSSLVAPLVSVQDTSKALPRYSSTASRSLTWCSLNTWGGQTCDVHCHTTVTVMSRHVTMHGLTCDMHCHTTVTVVQVLTHLSFKVSRKTSELGIFLQNDKDLSFAN